MIESIRSPIEIRDSALDGEAIVQYVQAQVAHRRAKGAYDSISTMLSADLLRPDQPGSLLIPTPDEFPGLRESLAELIAAGQLHEPDFTSSAPYVGPLIVAVRRLWNWMSTKWYVRPILLQQTDVNARTTRVISELVRWHALDTHRLSQLEKRVAELEASLAHLQARIES
jgi:hypothetical protein